MKAIPGAQPGDRFVWIGRPGTPPLARLLTGEQALDLGVGDPVMAPLRACRPDVASMDPALEGGVSDSQAFGRRSDRDECHPRVLRLESYHPHWLLSFTSFYRRLHHRAGDDHENSCS